MTLRDRDTMEQQRVAIDRLPEIVGEQCSLNNLLKKLV